MCHYINTILNCEVIFIILHLYSRWKQVNECVDKADGVYSIQRIMGCQAECVGIGNSQYAWPIPEGGGCTGCNCQDGFCT